MPAANPVAKSCLDFPPSSRPDLILASGSPRRAALLRTLGVRFKLIVSDAEELTPDLAPKMPAEQLALMNARRKAEAVALRQPGATILGADTVVAVEGQVLGKPADLAEAHRFLHLLSGRTHRVITGCAIIASERPVEMFAETSEVTFHPLTAATITNYLSRVSVLDKAGGYALQEEGDRLVARVEGSRANVIGLPIEALRHLLAAWIDAPAG